MTFRTPDPPAALPDDLLEACSRGDRHALGRLFDLLRDRVYAIAQHICGDPAAAADITQDVFIKVFTHLPQFDGRSAFTTWLYRIVVNTTVDHHRASRRYVPIEDPMPDRERSADAEYATIARKARITAALKLLPPALRVPVVLRHVEGLSYVEIAAALDVAPGTVASRLSRAYVRLARELADFAPEGT